MTARETRRADELTIGDHIFDSRTVREITGAHTVGGRTTLMDSDGESWRIVAGTNYQLATAEEIADQQRERDQRTVGNALRAVGAAIVDRHLPVPPGGRGVVLSFDLADDADLKPWEQWLSTRPRRGTSRPLIQAEAEGVEVYVYGPGNSGEFGPDLTEPTNLADAAQAEEDLLWRDVRLAREPLGPAAWCAHVQCPKHAPSAQPHPRTASCPISADEDWASYARTLDACDPGWWKADAPGGMQPGLVAEAQRRRDVTAHIRKVVEQINPPGGDVERRDAVGAFPVVAGRELTDDEIAEEIDRAFDPTPERDGWAPPGGHKTAATEDAYRADRYSEGQQQ